MALVLGLVLTAAGQWLLSRAVERMGRHSIIIIAMVCACSACSVRVDACNLPSPCHTMSAGKWPDHGRLTCSSPPGCTCDAHGYGVQATMNAFAFVLMAAQAVLVTRRNIRQHSLAHFDSVCGPTQ